MKAYKWLSPGGVGLFSDFTWPPPGQWVDTQQDVVDCLHGVHALRVEQLLDWIDDELWEVELGGAVTDCESMLVAKRGRLVRRVEEWNEASARSFSDACAHRSAGFAARALRQAGLSQDAERVEAAGDLSAVQNAVAAALPATSDPAVSEVVAFAADMVSLVSGGRPDTWGEPVSSLPAVQTPGAVAANAAFVTAHAAGRAAVAAASDETSYGAGFSSERAWQLAWLRENLGLE